MAGTRSKRKARPDDRVLTQAELERRKAILLNEILAIRTRIAQIGNPVYAHEQATGDPVLCASRIARRKAWANLTEAARALGHKTRGDRE
jgi:hypothetical protein